MMQALPPSPPARRVLCRLACWLLGALLAPLPLGCGAAKPTEPAKPSVDEFKGQILGKTKDQLLESLGKPDKTQKSGGDEYWYYDSRAVDPKTKEPAFVQVIIKGGKAVKVNY